MIRAILGFFNGRKALESMQTPDIVYDPVRASINKLLMEKGLDPDSYTKEEGMRLWAEKKDEEDREHDRQRAERLLFQSVSKKLHPRKLAARKRTRKSRHLRGFLTEATDWESLKVSMRGNDLGGPGL